MALCDDKKQYCRYCANALDYNGEGTDFVCNANAPCGDTYFEILIGNKIRTFYAAECGIGFLTLIEIIDTDKGEQEE